MRSIREAREVIVNDKTAMKRFRILRQAEKREISPTERLAITESARSIGMCFPSEVIDLLFDSWRLNFLDSMLQQITDSNVADSWDNREDGYMELRAIRERIRTLARRVQSKLGKDYLTAAKWTLDMSDPDVKRVVGIAKAVVKMQCGKG